MKLRQDGRDIELQRLLMRLADHAQSLAHAAERSCIVSDEGIPEETFSFFRGRARAFRQIENELREIADGRMELP